MTYYPSIEQFHRAAARNERPADVATQEYLAWLTEWQNEQSIDLRKDNQTFVDAYTAIDLQRASFKICE
jgi:hypothetical protein